ncbi:MAG TPA: hypothetical protein V6D17_01750, partial [Candidatus Obscuribacterales bacterium]
EAPPPRPEPPRVEAPPEPTRSTAEPAKPAPEPVSRLESSYAAPHVPPELSPSDTKADALSARLDSLKSGSYAKPQISEPAADSSTSPAKETPPPAASTSETSARAEPSAAPPVEPSTTPQSPEAKDLIKKMEEISKTAAPEWCIQFSFPGLNELKVERSDLNDQIKQIQQRISTVESRIALLDGIKNALLTAEGDELVAACQQAFAKMGWTATISPNNRNELWLASGEKADVLAHVVKSTAQAKRTDLALLGESVINYWGEHEQEPKGLLVACTWSNRPPSERSEPDFTDALAEFAKKKNLCLMTTMQLLCIFKDLELGMVTQEDVRRRIIETSGILAGFSLDGQSKASA